MARKLLVSSRKVVPQGSATKQGSQQVRASSDESGSNPQMSSEGEVTKPASSSSSAASSSDENDTTPIKPLNTPRGKQLRLDAISAENDSSSESYACIESSEDEQENEKASTTGKKIEIEPKQSKKKIVKAKSPQKTIPIKPKIEKKEKKKKIPKKETPPKVESKINGVRSQEPPKMEKAKLPAEKKGTNRRKQIDLDKYVMSEYIRDELLLVAKPLDTEVFFDEKKSKRFREALVKGVIKRVKVMKKSVKSETKFANNLTTKLEAEVEKTKLEKLSSGSTGSSDTLRSTNTNGKRIRNGEDVDEPQAKRKVVDDKAKDYLEMDPSKLKSRAEDLMKEARDFKHLGDREDKKSSSRKRAEYYLKSSIKCFEYCVVWEDINEIYKAKKKTEKVKGENIRGILQQSASLVEAAAYSFNASGEKKMMAMCYKFAAIVYMYQFRTQRVKLERIHSDLQKAHQADKAAKALGNKKTPLSPGIADPKGATNSNSPGGGPAIAVQSVAPGSFEFYLKGTSNMFKSFELWSRSQRIDRSVLPSITELATVSAGTVIAALKEIDYNK